MVQINKKFLVILSVLFGLLLATQLVRVFNSPKFFASCSAARAAHHTNIVKSDPYYRRSLDGDGDGVACEGGY